MNGLADGFVLSIMVCLADKPSVHWNMRSCWRVSQVVGPELRNYSERKLFGLWSTKWNGLQIELLKSNSRLGSLIILSGTVYTGWKSAEWTWRWADLWNDFGFSLCTVLSVCRVVTASDEGEKVWVEVSAEWCVAVEYWRSSSIRDYLCRLSD